jgi:two-component system chemotaxis response regulator CheB
VLVVDDSALVRRMLGQVLAEDRHFELVGFARDGAEALLRAAELEPDVITLDQVMPCMTGLEALPELALQSTARVVMLSSVEDPDTAYAALELGAVEFVSKPRDVAEAGRERFGQTLRIALETAFLVPPERRAAAAHAARLARAGTRVHPPQPTAAERAPGGVRPRAPRSVVAFAASTGGPPALEAVFAGLSAADDSAYLVVQHLPEGFAASLARRLGRVTDIACVEAADGAALEPGVAYVAPHGTHLTVAGTRRPVVRLEDGAPRHGLIPAGDPLFASVAKAFAERAVGVVLTGMGADGAEGLAAMRSAGAHTIVQDESSSTVWGMPGAAVRAGAAASVLPLGEIAVEIRRALAQAVVS